MVIELVGDWSFEICHSAAVAARPMVACYPLELVRLPEQERDARNFSLFTIHSSLLILHFSLFPSNGGSEFFTFHFSLFPSERLARVVRISPMGGKEVFLCLLRSIGGGRRRHSDGPSEALRWMTVFFAWFMVLGYRFLRPFGSKRQSRAIDSFLYCKGTKKNNAKQEFSGFIFNLFQMLKLRGRLRNEWLLRNEFI